MHDRSIIRRGLGSHRRYKPDMIIAAVLSVLVVYFHWSLIVKGYFHPWLQIIGIVVVVAPLWAACRPCQNFAALARNETHLAQVAMTGLSERTVFWSIMRPSLVINYIPLVLYGAGGSIHETLKSGFSTDMLFGPAFLAVPLAITADCTAYIAAAKSRAHWYVRMFASLCVAVMAIYAADEWLVDWLVPVAIIAVCAIIITVRVRFAIRQLFVFR